MACEIHQVHKITLIRNKRQRKPKGRSRMDNPEKLATRRGNQEWTIQRNWQHWVHNTQDKDNLEKLATLGTQYTGQRQTTTTTQKTKR